MAVTEFESETFPHRLTWSIAEQQARVAMQLETGWSNHGLIAMVFAFYAIEGYLNCVGARIAPDIWEDEENYFRREPYRGWKGKLHKVLDLLSIPWDPDARPLKTILELKDLRDAIAHAKPERQRGVIQHPTGEEHPIPEDSLRSMFTPKQKIFVSMEDADRFVELMHSKAVLLVDEGDVWFRTSALRGAFSAGSGDTHL